MSASRVKTLRHPLETTPPRGQPVYFQSAQQDKSLLSLDSGADNAFHNRQSASLKHAKSNPPYETFWRQCSDKEMASDGNVGQGSKDNNKGTYLGKYIIFISIGQASLKTNVNKKITARQEIAQEGWQRKCMGATAQWPGGQRNWNWYT